MLLVSYRINYDTKTNGLRLGVEGPRRSDNESPWTDNRTAAVNDTVAR